MTCLPTHADKKLGLVIDLDIARLDEGLDDLRADGRDLCTVKTHVPWAL